jgi:trigger factor
LAACKKLVKVEVDTAKVDETFATVTKEFQREANLPGFRPGKAPKEMVLRRFDKEIQDEVKRKLISESYKQVVEEKNLDVLGYPDIEEIQFGRGQPLHYAATVETAPEFELPEYKGIPVQKEAKTVTQEDIEKALTTLREQQLNYVTVERPAQTGDMVVVNYKGTCEGKPITDLAPTARGLTEKQSFWVEVGGTSFIPGFGEQLQGGKKGDQRTVTVDFPAEFVTPQLAGKKGVYEVEIVEVKEKSLPALDDAFAKSFNAENVEKLKEGVAKDLENELKHTQDRVVRNQLINSLLNRINFELPESAVTRETRNVVYDIVQNSARRGVSREIIEKQKDEIASVATQGAKGRVKANFILQKIAEKEDIKVSQEEIGRRVATLAAMYQIPVEKFAKDLQERNALIEVYDQLLYDKVLDFLQQNAKVMEVPPGTLEQSGGSPS